MSIKQKIEDIMGYLKKKDLIVVFDKKTEQWILKERTNRD